MSFSPIWLASYPRSGNTLLRTIFYHCFGFVSASIYPNDLGGNKELESYVGHIEHDNNEKVTFPVGAIPLIKTHEPPQNNEKAIYVVRDGRAACASVWEFYKRNISLEEIITGQYRFGTWANHISGWEPWVRPNTLLLKYEELLCDLPTVLDSISVFIGSEIINSKIPERDTIADIDGRWVKKKSKWRDVFNEEHIELFNQTNGRMMEKMGYVLLD
jgi:hypothetical protein